MVKFMELIFFFNFIFISSDLTGSIVFASADEWKTDFNRMVLDVDSNPITQISSENSNYQPSYFINKPKNNYREFYHNQAPENTHQHRFHLRHQNDLSNRLNKNEYPPNWTGGYYKYHQSGQTRIFHKGESVKVPITNGNFHAHRSKIISTVIKPGDEWKYQHLIERSHNQNNRRKHQRNLLSPNSKLTRKSRNSCVLCPEERTLIANKKRDKAYFIKPKLKSCSGRLLNSYYHFKSIYGPKPGDLLSAGTHALIGEIHYKNEPLMTCHLRVNVIVRQCKSLQLHPNITSQCDGGSVWGSECTFECSNPLYEIQDPDNKIICGDNLEWLGDIPVCTQKLFSCEMPITDIKVQVLCNTTNINDINDADNDINARLPEGTRCRFECEHGYRSVPRGSSAVCYRGKWYGNTNISCKRYRRNVAQRSRTTLGR